MKIKCQTKYRDLALLDLSACVDQEGGTGGLKNYKNIGFFSNTGPDSLKNKKATKPELNFEL